MATITHTSTLADILHLDQLSAEEQATLLDQIGTLIMESATLKYLAEASQATQERFVSYLASNEGEPDFLEDLLQTFPDFATVMAGEIQSFETDMRQVLGE